MTSDEDLIRQRQADDARTFMINSTDPEKAPRLAPAIRAVHALLADQQWHTHTQVIAAGLRVSDLAVKTVDNMVRKAVAVGFVERSGEYIHGHRGKRSQDSRRYRLVEWPEN